MHGYALDLLQRLVPETFKFSVLTDITSRLLVDRNSRQSGLTVCPTSSAGTPTLRRYIHSRLFLQATSVLREDDVDWNLVPDGRGVVVQRLHEADLREGVLRLHRDHQPAPFSSSRVTRTTTRTRRRFSGHIRDDIRYVVVDEYQDVNPLQERLVRGLTQFGANLCVVGDDDQTIYQWRGSEVSNIVTFADRYAGVHQVTLAENFRSSEGVVEVGQIGRRADPRRQRLPKAMVAGGAPDAGSGAT